MIGYFYILIAVLSWGMEYVLIKAGADKIGALMSGAILFTVTSSCLFLFSLQHKQLKKIILDNLSSLIPIALFGTCVNVFWLLGIEKTTVSNAAILGKSDILFSILLSFFFFHEKVKKSDIIAIILMNLGILLALNSDLNSFQFGNLGDFYILIAALIMTINAYLIKKCIKKVKPEIIAFCNTFINAIVFIILTLIFTEAIDSNSFVFKDSYLILIGAGICTFIFCIGYYRALKTVFVWKIRLLCLFVPLVSIIANWFLYEKIPSMFQVSGGCFILLGGGIIILSDINKKK